LLGSLAIAMLLLWVDQIVNYGTLLIDV